ncbi:hypothetical protein BHE74_00009671 [Ensete ventricosum]|nr:hypothetical protein BHE74_00009671 [Ensete ventricosum]
MAIVRVVGLAMERPYGPGKYNSESTDPSRRISLVELPAGFPKITLEVEGDERLIEEMDAVDHYKRGGKRSNEEEDEGGKHGERTSNGPVSCTGTRRQRWRREVTGGSREPACRGDNGATFTRASNDYFALLRYCLVIGSGRGHHVGSTKRRDPIGCRPLVAVTGKHFYCTDEMTCTLEDSLQTMQSTFADMVI